MHEPIFPGMDPFIENSEWHWKNFHAMLTYNIYTTLAAAITPRYVVVRDQAVRLRVRFNRSSVRGKKDARPPEASALKVARPTRIIEPTISQVGSEAMIEIYDHQGHCTTAIRILVPANKDELRDSYLDSRNALLHFTKTNLIEIDLLRGGERMELDFPTEGYVILVARAREGKSHRGEVYEFGLRDPLPIIPVPLSKDDPDVPLNLPQLFRDIYIEGRYRLQVDYSQMPLIPLAVEDQVWLQSVLAAVEKP